MEYLHVDYWSADLDGIDFFLIGSGGEVSYNLEVTSKGMVKCRYSIVNFL